MVRFKPHRGTEVSRSEFTQVDIVGLGRVWACLEGEINISSANGKRNVRLREPRVVVLGWGDAPYVDFSSLPKETQNQLIQHRLESISKLFSHGEVCCTRSR